MSLPNSEDVVLDKDVSSSMVKLFDHDDVGGGDACAEFQHVQAAGGDGDIAAHLQPCAALDELHHPAVVQSFAAMICLAAAAIKFR